MFTRADEEAAWKTLFDFLKADDGRPRWLPGMNLRRAALSYHARAAGPAPEVIAMGSLSFHLWRAVVHHMKRARSSTGGAATGSPAGQRAVSNGDIVGEKRLFLR